MHQLAAALAHHGIATFRYDYPYSHQLEAGYHEHLIDPLPVLLATTRAAANAARDLAPDLPLFLGGRSMSSQVMSLALAQEPWPHVRGLILYVFPMRWRVLLRDTITHLPQVPVPMLFIQGNRDHEFCDLTQLQPVIDKLAPQSVRREPALSSPNGPGQRLRRPVSNHPSGTAPNPHATLHVIPGANHAFTPPTPIQPNPAPRPHPSRHHHRHLDPATIAGARQPTTHVIRVTTGTQQHPPTSVIPAYSAGIQHPDQPHPTGPPRTPHRPQPAAPVFTPTPTLTTADVALVTRLTPAIDIPAYNGYPVLFTS